MDTVEVGLNVAKRSDCVNKHRHPRPILPSQSVVKLIDDLVFGIQLDSSWAEYECDAIRDYQWNLIWTKNIKKSVGSCVRYRWSFLRRNANGHQFLPRVDTENQWHSQTFPCEYLHTRLHLYFWIYFKWNSYFKTTRKFQLCEVCTYLLWEPNLFSYKWYKFRLNSVFLLFLWSWIKSTIAWQFHLLIFTSICKRPNPISSSLTTMGIGSVRPATRRTRIRHWAESSTQALTPIFKLGFPFYKIFSNNHKIFEYIFRNSRSNCNIIDSAVRHRSKSNLKNIVVSSHWRNGTEDRLSEEGVGLCEIYDQQRQCLSNVHVVERKSINNTYALAHTHHSRYHKNTPDPTLKMQHSKTLSVFYNPQPPC